MADHCWPCDICPAVIYYGSACHKLSLQHTHFPRCAAAIISSANIQTSRPQRNNCEDCMKQAINAIKKHKSKEVLGFEFYMCTSFQVCFGWWWSTLEPSLCYLSWGTKCLQIWSGKNCCCQTCYAWCLGKFVRNQSHVSGKSLGPHSSVCRDYISVFGSPKCNQNATMEFWDVWLWITFPH